MNKNIAIIVLSVIIGIGATLQAINEFKFANQKSIVSNMRSEYKNATTEIQKQAAVVRGAKDLGRSRLIRADFMTSEAKKRESETWCDNLTIVMQNVVAQMTFDVGYDYIEVVEDAYSEALEHLSLKFLDAGCIYYYDF